MIDGLSTRAQVTPMQESTNVRSESLDLATKFQRPIARFAGVEERAGRVFRFRRSRAPDPVVVGFTLIEILVVVVILGILALAVVPKIMGKPGEARIVQAKQNLQSVTLALDMYKLDNHRYPSSEQGLQALVSRPSGSPEAPNWKGPYLDRLPKDPWDHPYQYQQPGQHGDVDIYSYGADGRPGGDGDDADIGNWE
jgi:general secretion pathway protein G